MKLLSKAYPVQNHLAAAETGAVARTRGVPETSSQEFYSQKSVRGVWGYDPPRSVMARRRCMSSPALKSDRSPRFSLH